MDALGASVIHAAAIYDRGGQRKIAELTPLSRIVWNRVRDNTSQATAYLEVPSEECATILGLISTGRHELVVFRNEERVWEGPVTLITYRKGTVEIKARDVLHYVHRTILRSGYDNSSPNNGSAITRLNTILTTELARKEALTPPINVLPYLTTFVTVEDAVTAAVTTPYQMTTYEHLLNLAERGGIDFTVVGRSIVLSDYNTPLGKTGTLTEDDFLGSPVITEYGMEVSTYSVLTDGFGSYGATEDVIDPFYGEWEMLETAVDETTQNPGVGEWTVEEMQSQAARLHTARMPAPTSVRVAENSTLNPCGSLTITDLVPGVWMPLTAELPGRTFSQVQKLDSVTVEETPKGESIRVSMSPANSEGDLFYRVGKIVIGGELIWVMDPLGEWNIELGEFGQFEVIGGLEATLEIGGIEVDAQWWTPWVPAGVDACVNMIESADAVVYLSGGRVEYRANGGVPVEVTPLLEYTVSRPMPVFTGEYTVSLAIRWYDTALREIATTVVSGQASDPLVEQFTAPRDASYALPFVRLNPA